MLLRYFNNINELALRCRVIFSFILTSCICFSTPVYAQKKTTIHTVVIDAGHGGKDPGTIGKKTQEKYVNLGIALKLAEIIRKSLPDVNVILTRDKDEFIELHERASIANRQNADLFISIHCNANHSQIFHGAETYIMGLHRSAANLEIAKTENASILMEPDYSKKYDGFDPNSDESYITFSLFQNAFLYQSTEFAATVQDELKDRGGLDDRGVKQAGFLVLYKTTMPSVLVEAGFLSNPEEEKFLISDKGQEYIATAIFRAFNQFKLGIEGGGKAVTEKIQTGQGDPKPDTPAIFYRVQFAMFPTEVNIHSSKFTGVPDVRIYHHQGMFKYTSGNEKSLENAVKLSDSLKHKGFRDAFVVAFKDEARITIQEAKKLQSDGNGRKN
ncbi:MAG: N-acetylmuramoyl-L-alanine amidase [Bacteroidetes bacterium]|nr:N-acetylmuramoyl-L-alanine amidase [Bacteroidota bacterium]